MLHPGMGGGKFRHPLPDIASYGKLAGADCPIDTEADDFSLVQPCPLTRLCPGPLDRPQVGEFDAPSVTEGDAHVLQACDIRDTPDSADRLLGSAQASHGHLAG